MSPEPKFQAFPILLNFYSVVLSFKNTKCLLPLRMVDTDDDVMTGALAVFTSALDDVVVSWIVEVGTTVAVAEAFFVAVIEAPVVYVPTK